MLKEFEYTKIDISPGDVLVIKTFNILNVEDIERIKRTLPAGCEVIVLPVDAEISVLETPHAK